MNITYRPIYVVTYPSKFSELIDICFKTTFSGLRVQYDGGLEERNIFGIFDNEPEAMESAGKLLAEAQG
jgi:hypothetical protein